LRCLEEASHQLYDCLERVCITLLKDDNEDDYLRELWRSMVVIRSSYLFHSSKLKKKSKDKRARDNRRVDGRPPPGSATLPVEAPSTSTKVVDLTTSKTTAQEAPVRLPPLVQQSDTKVMATTTTSTSKKWADIVSPPKLTTAQAASVPVAQIPNAQKARPQPPHRESEKGDKEEPPKSTKPENKEKKKKEKTPSSSSSDEHPPKKKPTDDRAHTSRQVEPVAMYKQWIRELSREDINIKAIKKLDVNDDKKITFYCVWEGRGRGIFLDWDSCSSLVNKCPGAKFRKFIGSLADMLKFYREKLKT